jgi:hypothetical protein
MIGGNVGRHVSGFLTLYRTFSHLTLVQPHHYLTARDTPGKQPHLSIQLSRTPCSSDITLVVMLRRGS